MMDEIREEFEKEWEGSSIYDYLIFNPKIDFYEILENEVNPVNCRFRDIVNGSYIDFKKGYKSRDEEISDLNYALRAMRALNKATLNNLSSRDKEIRELKAFKKIHYPLLESSNKAAEQLKAKIKKLMDALKFIIGTAKTIEDAEKVAKKTLKDISYE